MSDSTDPACPSGPPLSSSCWHPEGLLRCVLHGLVLFLSTLVSDPNRSLYPLQRRPVDPPPARSAAWVSSGARTADPAGPGRSGAYREVKAGPDDCS
jgi:hypothetical protein